MVCFPRTVFVSGLNRMCVDVEKYRDLLKNAGVLTLGSFAAKLLSFFLVPLYTNILTTAEYGTCDLLNTSIALLTPLLTLNIQEAVMRFSIDQGSSREGVFTAGALYALFSCGIVALALLVNAAAGLSETLLEYAALFLLWYAAATFTGIFSAFARGMNRFSAVSVSGILSSAVTIGANLLFLLFLGWGVNGYLLAHVLGISVSAVYLFLSLKLWKYWKRNGADRTLRKEMRAYSAPMTANTVCWWVNNASDRYIVTWILGVAETGIYSVAYKIPTILSLLQQIFGQAWSLSAVKDYEEEDRSGFFSSVYSLYHTLLVLLCSFLMLTDKILASVLFAEDFYAAWVYVPFLMIGTVFSGLSGYFGGVLSALKKTGTLAVTSALSAGVNLVLNVILVSGAGAQGAAAATAAAYFILWLFRWHAVRKYTKIRISPVRNGAACLLLLVQAAVLITSEAGRLLDWHQVLFFCLLCLLHLDVIRKCGSGIVKSLKQR